MKRSIAWCSHVVDWSGSIKWCVRKVSHLGRWLGASCGWPFLLLNATQLCCIRCYDGLRHERGEWRGWQIEGRERDLRRVFGGLRRLWQLHEQLSFLFFSALFFYRGYPSHFSSFSATTSSCFFSKISRCNCCFLILPIEKLLDNHSVTKEGTVE